jgi:hypothetical protein
LPDLDDKVGPGIDGAGEPNRQHPDFRTPNLVS